MAQSLSLPGSNVSPAKFEEWCERLEEADRVVSEANAGRKAIRLEIKGAGVPLAAFDRARADAKVSAAVRDHEQTWYQFFMQWYGKPIPSVATEDEDGGVSEIRLARAEREGYEAGKSGRHSTENSWPVGSEGFARWHTGWSRGDTEKKNGSAPAAAAASGERRGRGRPQGSKNKPKEGSSIH